MSARSFTTDEVDLIERVTGLSVKKWPQRQIASALLSGLRGNLDAFPIAYSIIKDLDAVLEPQDQVRFRLLLAIAASGERLNDRAAFKEIEERIRRTEEVIDHTFDWWTKGSHFTGESLQAALGYHSRNGFVKLRRRYGIKGESPGKGLPNYYTSEEARTLLRGRLAELPHWEARLVAARLASTKTPSTRRGDLFSAIAFYLEPHGGRKNPVTDRFDAIAPSPTSAQFKRSRRK